MLAPPPHGLERLGEKTRKPPVKSATIASTFRFTR
jgi:hypothetical protein